MTREEYNNLMRYIRGHSKEAGAFSFLKPLGAGAVAKLGNWGMAGLLIMLGVVPVAAGTVAGKLQSAATSPNEDDLVSQQKKNLARDIKSMTARLKTQVERKPIKNEFADSIWRP